MQTTISKALRATPLVLVVLAGILVHIECNIDWLSLLIKSDPDEYIPTPDLIRSKGYPAEEHHVVTEVMCALKKEKQNKKISNTADICF
jgi:hypothetical protein